MVRHHIEAQYPIDFREEDAKILGEHLRLRHSVELVGMKRVGISNFLRFFLYHKDIVPTYINKGEKHLFIPVDLNHLVEIDLFPFWMLLFKRLVDKVEESDMDEKLKKDISVKFLETIQSRDLFLTIETLRNVFLEIVKENYLPTFYLLRFDRLEPVVNADFFANLESLQEETAHKIAYVFTSFRSLDEISPDVFPRKLLSVFSHPMYVKAAKEKDMETIFKTLEDKYNIRPSDPLKKKLLELCGGHVQFLQLSLIILNQRGKVEDVTPDNLLEVLTCDERITLQAEEIWESLSKEEKRILLKVHQGEDVEESEKEEGSYLWEAGMIVENGKSKIFSPLFESYLDGLKNQEVPLEKIDLTKKEKLLYDLLLENKDNVCEREKIIEAVWSEVEELGVSDWTIDRLVARLRTKLKNQKSRYSVVTVKTRGYKLTE